MPQIDAVVHVSWELPFPLRLPPAAFFIWEPEYGVGVLDPQPRVGDLTWRRTSSVLPASAVFAQVGPEQEHAFPDHDYVVMAQLNSGQQVPTMKLLQGPDGGFVEPRAYSHVNLFLCLDDRSKYSDPTTGERAAAALNNVLDLYRFVTMDPLARGIQADKDCYYTMSSVADVPDPLKNVGPEQLLSHLGELLFGHVLGENRAHTIGLNSYEDVFVGGSLTGAHLQLLTTLSRTPHQLELFHQLVFSAIRRLKRREEALAVLDAQTALESLVAVLIREDLTRQGKSDAEIDAAMGSNGPFRSLQRRLVRLDEIAAGGTGTAPAASFLNSPIEQDWRQGLYRLRNRIVHEGLRTVSFEEAKAALITGLKAIWAIQALHPTFGRQLIWSGAALDLPHIQKTAGRLARLFEV